MDKDLLKQKIETVFTNFKAAIKQHSDVNKREQMADGVWEKLPVILLREPAHNLVKL